VCVCVCRLSKDYQPRTNLVKEENDDQFANSHNNLNRCKYYFYQILALKMLGG
jgi:hypothetical protein